MLSMANLELLTILALILGLGIGLGLIVLHLYLNEDNSGDKGKYHKSMDHYRDGDNT